MEKKTELVQFRTTKTRKNNIENRAKLLGLSTAKYMENCTDDSDKLLSIFDKFKDEIDEVKEGVNNSFHYLKQDTEELLSESKKESNLTYSTINLEDNKSNINTYKVDDILTALVEDKELLYRVENIFDDSIGVQNLHNLKRAKITLKDTSAIIKLTRKKEV